MTAPGAAASAGAWWPRLTAELRFAAAGVIPPTIGAMLQEVIDIASIVNGLRASRA